MASTMPKEGSFFIARTLGRGKVLRNIGKNATAHVAAPHDAGNRHSDKGGGDTDEDHGAQVDTERAGDQNRPGGWRHKRIASGKSREQRDAVVERRLFGLRCHAKRRRNQNDYARLKEHRGADDQTGDAQRPAGVALAKGVNEGLGNLVAPPLFSKIWPNIDPRPMSKAMFCSVVPTPLVTVSATISAACRLRYRSRAPRPSSKAQDAA